MICENHDQKIIAICQKCKNLLCLQCIFQLHEPHLHQIILIKTLSLLANSINACLAYYFYENFYKDSIICYEMLFSKYQCQFFFAILCHFLYEAKRMEKSKNYVIKQLRLIHIIIMPACIKVLLKLQSYHPFQARKQQNFCLKYLQLIDINRTIKYYWIYFSWDLLMIKQKYNNIKKQNQGNSRTFEGIKNIFLKVLIQLKTDESFNPNSIKKKYKDSLMLVHHLIFQNKAYNFYLELIILLKMKNFPLLYDCIFLKCGPFKVHYYGLDYVLKYQTNSNINRMAFHDEAINLLQGYDDLKERKNFYHVLLGKLIVDQGIKFNDMEIIQKGLNELTYFDYDEYSLHHVFFYKGQALLKMNRFEEATNNFENAYYDQNVYYPYQEILHEILIAHKFIQGNFQEVTILLEKQECLQPEFSNLIVGLLLWVSDYYDKQVILLQQLTLEFPLIYFPISQILGEQNKKKEEAEILQKLQQLFPKFKIFCEKTALITSGPYSSYIINNIAKFELFDDKKQNAIKILAVYLECNYVSPLFLFFEQRLLSMLLVAVERENYIFNYRKQYKIIETYTHI